MLSKRIGVFGGSLAVAILLSAVAVRAQTGLAYTNSVGMEFVRIPAGSFYMGTPRPDCPRDDPFTERNEYEDCMSQVYSDETPQHRVSISRAFYLGKYEVTQEEWYKVMGNNPAEFKSEKVGGNSRRHPVEKVSWEDAQEFVRRLNAREGTDAYRLPTEAEWEYACRAGTTGDRYGDVASVAWYDGNSGNRTHPVGQKRPNAWGLYDMLGNVREWCSDWHGGYPSGSVTDPRGPSSGSGRVYRGGGWGDGAQRCRAANRYDGGPGIRGSDLGFRLARVAR